MRYDDAARNIVARTSLVRCQRRYLKLGNDIEPIGQIRARSARQGQGQGPPRSATCCQYMPVDNQFFHQITAGKVTRRQRFVSTTRVQLVIRQTKNLTNG